MEKIQILPSGISWNQNTRQAKKKRENQGELDHLVIFQDSAPYSRVLKTLFLKNHIFVFWVMFLDLQVPRSEAKAWFAFEIWTRISSSPSPLVDTLDPR